MKKKYFLLVCMVLITPALLLPSAKAEQGFVRSVLDELQAVPVENGYQLEKTKDLDEISFILRQAGYDVRRTNLSFEIEERSRGAKGISGHAELLPFPTGI